MVDEEQFGPVLPVMSFSNEKEAVERANATSWGLGGSVWSTNLDKAYELAEQMDAGTVWINKHLELDPSIPFGGSKQSRRHRIGRGRLGRVHPTKDHQYG